MRLLQLAADVAIADLAARTIEGVIVPYGEVGSIAGTRYRFAPGSLRLARARPPLLVDHDRGRPVGVLAELVDGDRSALARFTIDSTQDGDTALVQAASGSRGSLSVGAELVEAAEGDDGVVDVSSALLHEVSLLALGAFTGATVTRVAAELEEPEPEPEPAPEPEPDPEPDDPAEPEEDQPMEAAAASPAVITADRSRAPRELSAGAFVKNLILAQRGDAEAARVLVEAALTESDSTALTGLLPPTYERNVLGVKTVPRVLFGIFNSRPLPGVGLTVHKPKWTTQPSGGWAASVDADPTTGPVVIDTQQANVERWDFAVAIPWVVVQRSDPNVLDEIYAAAVLDFYIDVEDRIATTMGAAAVNAATTLGAGIAAFFEQSGRAPEVIVVAPDVWGDMADTKELDLSVGVGDDFIATGVPRASYAGLPIVASPEVASGSRFLATRRAIDARVTDPVRLTAQVISALNIELGVVGEGLFDTDWPNEIMALTAGALTRSSRGGSKVE